jgi:hypothetical protein
MVLEELPLVEPEDGVGVADVDDEEHPRFDANTTDATESTTRKGLYNPLPVVVGFSQTEETPPNTMGTRSRGGRRGTGS